MFKKRRISNFAFAKGQISIDGRRERGHAGHGRVGLLLLCYMFGVVCEPADAEPQDQSPEPQAHSPQPQAQSPEAEPKVTDAPPSSLVATCDALRRAAEDNGLPVPFFSRLIWQESRLDPVARSRAGALGIAQFMPSTAAWRGLADPYNPIQSLKEGARYLHDLRSRFGNIGLAAAAYNAGPQRLSNWLAGKTALPAETMAYVRIVTGRPASDWKSATAEDWNSASLPAEFPCSKFITAIPADSEAERSQEHSTPPVPPWGVHIAGDWTERGALARYDVVRRRYAAILGGKDPIVVVTYGGLGLTKRYLARAPENTREDAQRLCMRLKELRANCDVYPNGNGSPVSLP
jgi:hypothetical protein